MSVSAKSLQSCPTLTVWTIACQAPRSKGFSRQECWSRLPCPHSGDLSNPGIEPESPASPALQADSLPSEPPGEGLEGRTQQISLGLFRNISTRIQRSGS